MDGEARSTWMIQPGAVDYKDIRALGKSVDDCFEEHSFSKEEETRFVGRSRLTAYDI